MIYWHLFSTFSFTTQTEKEAMKDEKTHLGAMDKF